MTLDMSRNMATASSSPPSHRGPSPPSSREIELERKRARDRKSQQAMRDRAKWTLQNLTDQVAQLTRALEEQTKSNGTLTARVQALEHENEHLRIQTAALRLSLMGDASQSPASSAASTHLSACPAWQIPPINTGPTCLSDEILQGFVNSRRRRRSIGTPGEERAAAFPVKPNLCSLLDKDQRAEDETSNVVGDIVRSYTEIESLPKQVAVHYVMSTFLKWMLLLDEPSWSQLPAWLRPIPEQLATPHAAWIDRIPWPRARAYLVAHPTISLDDFAAVYSSSFMVQWPYDPSHVLITTHTSPSGAKEVITNPIFEEHIQHLKHWTVGEAFRVKFPLIAELIDQDVNQT
jgi:hypothetical protein